MFWTKLNLQPVRLNSSGCLILLMSGKPTYSCTGVALQTQFGISATGWVAGSGIQGSLYYQVEFLSEQTWVPICQEVPCTIGPFAAPPDNTLQVRVAIRSVGYLIMLCILSSFGYENQGDCFIWMYFIFYLGRTWR